MPLTIFVILSFVVFRVTRFLMHDTLIDEPRMWVLRKIAKARSDGKGGYEVAAWRRKLLELVQCWWCLSTYVAAGAVVVADQFTSVPLPWLMWLAVGGGAVFIADKVEGS